MKGSNLLFQEEDESDLALGNKHGSEHRRSEPPRQGCLKTARSHHSNERHLFSHCPENRCDKQLRETQVLMDEACEKTTKIGETCQLSTTDTYIFFGKVELQENSFRVGYQRVSTTHQVCCWLDRCLAVWIREIIALAS